MNPKATPLSSTDQVSACQDQPPLQMEVREYLGSDLPPQQSEERFRALIENAQDIIAVLNENALILYKSPSVERILGYSPDELVGTNAFDMVHPEDLAQTKAFFTRVLQQSDVALTFELRLRHKQGAWRDIEAVFDNHLQQTAIRGVVVNYRDITQRVRDLARLRDSERQLDEAQRLAQLRSAALQESQENLYAIAEATPAVIVLSRLSDGAVLYANPFAYQLFGLTPDAPPSRLVSTNFYQNPADRAEIARQLALHKQSRSHRSRAET